MKLIGKNLLYIFKETYADARSQIESWESEVEAAQWNNPHDIKKRYPKASLVKNQHVVFDFCWNKYRLLVQVNYKSSIVLVKDVGTHKEYDKWYIA